MRSEVSRPQSSVVVSGGGTFRSAIASTTRAPASGSGPMRRQGVARGARETAAPYQRPTRGPDSVFNRLGERDGRKGGQRSLDFGDVHGYFLAPHRPSLVTLGTRHSK